MARMKRKAETGDPILFTMGAVLAFKSVDALHLSAMTAILETYFKTQKVIFRMFSASPDRVRYEMSAEDAATTLEWLRKHGRKMRLQPVDHFNI